MNKTKLTDIQKINLKNNIDVYSLAQKRKNKQVSMRLIVKATAVHHQTIMIMSMRKTIQ